MTSYEAQRQAVREAFYAACRCEDLETCPHFGPLELELTAIYEAEEDDYRARVFGETAESRARSAAARTWE